MALSHDIITMIYGLWICDFIRNERIKAKKQTQRLFELFSVLNSTNTNRYSILPCKTCVWGIEYNIFFPIHVLYYNTISWLKTLSVAHVALFLLLYTSHAPSILL